MTTENNRRELLKMDEVQACLGISKAYAYKLIKDRKIPSLRLGERGAIRVRGAHRGKGMLPTKHCMPQIELVTVDQT